MFANCREIFTITVLLTLCIAKICTCEKPPPAPLVFSSWPPKQHKSQTLRHQLMNQLRSTGRLPPMMMLKRYPQRIMHRPAMKLQVMPYYMMKKYPAPLYFKPTAPTPARLPFRSSPPAPHTGEYVYESPHASAAVHTSKSNGKITSENYSVIHTIPAPNLSYSTGSKAVHEAVDNHLHEKDQTKVPLPATTSATVATTAVYRPSTIHQYQVTETTNDHTIRDFPLGKNQQLNAAESAPVNSAYRFNAIPSFDAFHHNSIAGTKSSNDINVLAASAKVQSPANVHQLSGSIPQQQLSDTYVLPLSNQPQLQQHFLQQQQSPYGSISLPVYNPTYLVTQSNQLFNHHKQQLFKPAAAFAGTDQATVNLNTPDAQAIYQDQTVASPGQIYSAHQDRINEYSFASFPSASSSVNTPTFERLVSSDNPKSNTIDQNVQQQPILSEQEVAHLLNFGMLNGHSSPTFLTSNYYQTPSSDTPLTSAIEYDQPTRQQMLNENTIRQATEDIRQDTQQQVGTRVTTTPATTSYQFVSSGPTQTEKSTGVSALNQHEKRLAEHFSEQNPLRIYVPDVDISSNKAEIKRAYHDTVSSAEEFDSIEGQYAYDESPIVTTDGGEEYFSSENSVRNRKAQQGIERHDYEYPTTTVDNLKDYSTYTYF